MEFLSTDDKPQIISIQRVDQMPWWRRLSIRWRRLLMGLRIQRAARRGNTEAQQILPLYFPRRLGRAAKEGNAFAQWALAINYQYGKGVRRNPQAALYWLERAADQGFLLAQLTLARKLRDGESVDQNCARAMKYFLLAARQRVPSERRGLDDTIAVIADARIETADLYLNGTGVPQDKVTALAWYILGSEIDPRIRERAAQLAAQLPQADVAKARKLTKFLL